MEGKEGVSRRPPVSPSLLSPSPSKGKGESISPAGPPQAPPPKPSSPKVFLSGPLLPSERGGGGGMGRPSFPPPFLGLGLYGNPPPRLESAGQRPVFGRRVRAGGLLLLSSHSLAPSVRFLVGPSARRRRVFLRFSVGLLRRFFFFSFSFVSPPPADVWPNLRLTTHGAAKEKVGREEEGPFPPLAACNSLSSSSSSSDSAYLPSDV